MYNQDDFLEACRDEDIPRVKEILQDTNPIIDLNYYDDAYVGIFSFHTFNLNSSINLKQQTGILIACSKNNIELVTLLLADDRISLYNPTGYMETVCCLNQ